MRWLLGVCVLAGCEKAPQRASPPPLDAAIVAKAEPIDAAPVIADALREPGTFRTIKSLDVLPDLSKFEGLPSESRFKPWCTRSCSRRADMIAA